MVPEVADLMQKLERADERLRGAREASVRASAAVDAAREGDRDALVDSVVAGGKTPKEKAPDAERHLAAAANLEAAAATARQRIVAEVASRVAEVREEVWCRLDEELAREQARTVKAIDAAEQHIRRCSEIRATSLWLENPTTEHDVRGIGAVRYDADALRSLRGQVEETRVVREQESEAVRSRRQAGELIEVESRARHLARMDGNDPETVDWAGDRAEVRNAEVTRALEAYTAEARAQIEAERRAVGNPRELPPPPIPRSERRGKIPRITHELTSSEVERLTEAMTGKRYVAKAAVA